MFFFLSIVDPFLEIPVQEKDFPSVEGCKKHADIKSRTSQVWQVTLNPEEYIYIEGFPDSSDYNGEFVFIYTDIGDLIPYVYINRKGKDGVDHWFLIKGAGCDGVTTTGKYQGKLYIKNDKTTRRIISIGFTTFLKDCDEKYVTTFNSKKYNLVQSPKNLTRCYFNAAPGKKKFLLSVSQRPECFGVVWPMYPKYGNFFENGPIKETFNQYEQQIVQFKCSGSTGKKSHAYIKVEIEKELKYGTSIKITNDEPEFFQLNIKESPPDIVFPIVFGIVFGIAFLQGNMLFDLLGCFSIGKDMKCKPEFYSEKWFDLTCDCNLRRKGVDLIDYSYSDDVLADIPDYEE